MTIHVNMVWLMICVLAFSGELSAVTPQTARPPAFEWQTAPPESQGMSTAILNAVRDTLAAHRTKGFLVVRNDRIVYEWYAPDHRQDQQYGTASLAKALVSGTSLLWALGENLIELDAPAFHYVPEWKKGQKSEITVRQLATHSSGLADVEHVEEPDWMRDFWGGTVNPFEVSRDRVPLNFRPGSGDEYSNPGIAMLNYVVTSALQKSPYKDIRTLLRERIFGPIGLMDNEPRIGYDKTWDTNGLPVVPGWGGAAFTGRAFARMGRLMLRKGNWEGAQLLNALWVERATQYAGTPLPDRSEEPVLARGIVWYTNFDGTWPGVPRDAYLGSGAQDRMLLIVPSLNMIIVRFGRELVDGKSSSYAGRLEYVAAPVMAAVVEPPYPPSDLITGVEWAPAESVLRLADGSDNWPMTWADDGELYTAYGDGNGFEPFTDVKLSLGLAKVQGTPPDITGVNIRTLTGERMGGGRFGPKASGLLMIDGILYMWARNARWDGTQSQLTWSNDHGKTWQWSDWRFTESFGYPTFLNFGKNYQGARDGYVYVYSHDCPDAYKPADTMVLARVPKDRILDRDAYEFFTGLDKSGNPLWHPDMRRRGAVFTHFGQCYRSSVSYNAGLKRYLWCQTKLVNRRDLNARTDAGIGIFEAPEPWGPWKTVYYKTERQWDMGAGDTGCMPTKWMSADGKTCHLVFAGNDCFSLRKVMFTVR